jgi:hypothetical protein
MKKVFTLLFALAAFECAAQRVISGGTGITLKPEPCPEFEVKIFGEEVWVWELMPCETLTHGLGEYTCCYKLFFKNTTIINPLPRKNFGKVKRLVYRA